MHVTLELCTNLERCKTWLVWLDQLIWRGYKICLPSHRSIINMGLYQLSISTLHTTEVFISYSQDSPNHCFNYSYTTSPWVREVYSMSTAWYVTENDFIDNSSYHIAANINPFHLNGQIIQLEDMRRKRRRRWQWWGRVMCCEDSEWRVGWGGGSMGRVC